MSNGCAENLRRRHAHTTILAPRQLRITGSLWTNFKEKAAREQQSKGNEEAKAKEKKRSTRKTRNKRNKRQMKLTRIRWRSQRLTRNRRSRFLKRPAAAGAKPAKKLKV